VGFCVNILRAGNATMSILLMDGEQFIENKQLIGKYIFDINVKYTASCTLLDTFLDKIQTAVLYNSYMQQTYVYSYM
jgi:hypothetical protein